MDGDREACLIHNVWKPPGLLEFRITHHDRISGENPLETAIVEIQTLLDVRERDISHTKTGIVDEESQTPKKKLVSKGGPKKDEIKGPKRQ